MIQTSNPLRAKEGDEIALVGADLQHATTVRKVFQQAIDTPGPLKALEIFIPRQKLRIFIRKPMKLSHGGKGDLFHSIESSANDR